LTIGVFDGVHRGHQALLRRVLESARRDNLAAAAVTFHPHPRRVVHPDAQISYLTSLEDRLDLLLATGLDTVAAVTFTSELAQVVAEDFVQALIEELQLTKLVIGPDFALGRQRAGDPEALQRMCDDHGIAMELIDFVQEDDAKVSSSSVRHALDLAEIDQVNTLLGRRFSLHGPVVMGAERGRTIGFPTANIAVGADLAMPAHGVYATLAHLNDQQYQSVTNIGVRPTIDDGEAISVECHLFDFEGDLYGRDVRIDIVGRLRGEQRFDGLDALKAQIDADCAAARDLLANA
ncbi:MAG TPA: bifunctional riboflavin kinase/FAD synthetase, partial [Dehalococcoidia bacterium]|nr:bifunctional riboflavin kinase/FAD synthetase [Dehalococcoidia bacterium]